MDIELFPEQQPPSAVLISITFGISTEAEKEKISVLAIEAVNEVTDPKLGLPNPSSQCSTCGSHDVKFCEGHFGVIRFPFTILHPYYLSEVVHILNGICPGCKSVRKDLLAMRTGPKSRKNPHKGCKYCAGDSKDWYPTIKFKISSNDIFRKTAIVAEIGENLLKQSSRKAPKRKLAADFWDIIPKDEQQDENDIKPNKRVLSHAQVRHLLKDVDPSFIERSVLKKDSLFLNCFPVTPNSHRVTEVTHAFSNGQRLIFDDRTRAYKKLVDFRGKGNELSFRVMDCLKTSKLKPEKPVSDDIFILNQKLVNVSNSKTSGLRWMKDVVLGKRNDHSFRMVVVGDPNLRLSEIGIPCHVAERMHISEHLTAWNWEKLNACCEVRLLEKGEIHVRREGSLVRIRRTKELQVGDIIYRALNDGDTIMINRPPSIHPHSLIALSVKILPVTSVLAINPLCCPPLHGDFDGDCLHGYVPQSVETRAELHELVALEKQLTNAQSGRNLLSLSQDSLVAAHLVLEPGVFLTIFQMQQLHMFSPNKYLSPSIIRSPRNGCLWTGKQLISMLLPENFDHDFPSYNVNILKGELISSEGSFWLRDTDGNLFQSLTKQCQSQVLDFLYVAQEALCEWLSMRGLSVSLSELYLSPDTYSRKNMMDEIFCGLQDAEHTCNSKQFMVDSFRDFFAGNIEADPCAAAFNLEHLCFEKQRSAALSQASVDAFKEFFRHIQSLAYKYTSKTNSLLSMIKAGSKGNMLKLVQHSMCLGLQHSLVPLSFRMPHELSCAAWNKLKDDDAVECAKCYIPYAVVQNCFLSGLNPLECFIHSVTNRDSSFSDNADLPGTLTRRLMFFLRDLCIAYDGTVRSRYGNQLVQLSYGENVVVHDPKFVGGQPVGSLAACSISEAAYSALDQPISLLEKSPLLNLKNVLECGLKKSNANQTVSLFLSEKLGRQRHGFEYGALEVQNHLEKLVFLDIVSVTRIMSVSVTYLFACLIVLYNLPFKNDIDFIVLIHDFCLFPVSYSPQRCGKRCFSPWVCHFHIFKEIMTKRGLRLQSVIDALYKHCKSNAKTPEVLITCKNCSVADSHKEKEGTFCISVTIIDSSKDSSMRLETIKALMIPFLLEAVVKGLTEIKKVDILWNDRPRIPKPCHQPPGELYLRVSMSAISGKTKLWNLLVNHCLPVMDMIDWTRSHPDNIHEFCLAYGIDAGWKFFLNNLNSAISDVGKTVLPEHVTLVASSLSVTGEFVGLNAKGLKRQREQASVLSPFSQACFSSPGNCFIKAAKAGIKDDMQGSLDALAWGLVPPVGTGQFDIVYSLKSCELSEPVNVYDFLGTQISSNKLDDEIEIPHARSYKSDKHGAKFALKFGGYDRKWFKKTESISRSFLRKFFTYDDIYKLSRLVRKILNKYPLDHQLNETDKSILMRVLYFHPRKDEKIGPGAQHIKVVKHPVYQDSRCFSLVRTDGTMEDFSYHKCVHGALEIIAPYKAKVYHDKYFKHRYLGHA
ncbi:hypothetical protein K2173_005929 [Erythroxylum novogranatense]|uniref:DNA-directed RNA polymerase subunit n=1 Tax=Erythroxylum novogranatense TaxID=1862640 RepID=A0AAV8TSI1_9ROSI|nr:hypothetical protein K2173_005929 [Erythroxylum novogranatense]